MARAEITEARFLHALATNKSAEEIARTNQEATALNLEVQAVHKTRESQGKCPPTLYYTDKQYAELQSLKGERLAAAKDDRLAGVLAGYGEYVRQTTREECAQAERFIEERSGTVFEVEDGGRWSLQGIEGMIGRESERLGRIDDTKSQKNRRGESTSTLSKLKKTGWEIQEKIAVREKQLLQTAEAARWRFEVVSRAIEEAKEVRAQAGKSWPSPIYSPEAYQNLDHLAHRTRDARLAKHLHERSLGANNKPEFIVASAEIEFGRELVARKELLQKEASYREASDLRSPNRDKAGSVSQTVSAPHVKQVVAEYQGARNYYEARREIVDDHLRLLGLSREDIVPRVSSEELKEITRYSDSIKPNKENKVFIRQTSRARLHQHEQLIFVQEKPVSRDKEPKRSAVPSKKSRIRDAKTAIEKLLLESTRTGKGALHPVENVLQVANAAREELTRRGVTLKEIGYTREQWASTLVDNAVRDLHRYCLSSSSGEHDFSFKQSQSLLNAVNRNDPGLLLLAAGPANSEGTRALDIESPDLKEEHTLLKTQGASRAEGTQLSNKDPHVRAGLIQGQFIEEYVKLGFLEQSGVVVDRGNLEYLRLEMMNADGEHLKQYGGMPLAILSKEQKELAQSYKEMHGQLPEQIHDKLQDGLIIGESRTDSRLEREQVHEQVREFIEELSR